MLYNASAESGGTRTDRIGHWASFRGQSHWTDWTMLHALASAASPLAETSRQPREHEEEGASCASTHGAERMSAPAVRPCRYAGRDRRAADADLPAIERALRRRRLRRLARGGAPCERARPDSARSRRGRRVRSRRAGLQRPSRPMLRCARATAHRPPACRDARRRGRRVGSPQPLRGRTATSRQGNRAPLPRAAVIVEGLVFPFVRG